MPILLAEQIETLAAFPATALPVISLYLNTQSDDHGRDRFASFQVEEVLLSTSLKQFRGEEDQGLPWEESTSSAAAGENVSETIVAHARQTGARFRLIEDATLLDEVGGVCASLRYRS